jgi:hypothetical protein
MEVHFGVGNINLLVNIRVGNIFIIILCKGLVYIFQLKGWRLGKVKDGV